MSYVIQELCDEIVRMKHALDDQGRELSKLREWYAIVTGAGSDQESIVRMEAARYTEEAVLAWRTRYDQLMSDAIWAYRLLECMPPDRFLPEGLERVQCFLKSKHVKCWESERGVAA